MSNNGFTVKSIFGGADITVDNIKVVDGGYSYHDGAYVLGTYTPATFEIKCDHCLYFWVRTVGDKRIAITTGHYWSGDFYSSSLGRDGVLFMVFDKGSSIYDSKKIHISLADMWILQEDETIGQRGASAVLKDIKNDIDEDIDEDIIWDFLYNKDIPNVPQSKEELIEVLYDLWMDEKSAYERLLNKGGRW